MFARNRSFVPPFVPIDSADCRPAVLVLALLGVLAANAGCAPLYCERDSDCGSQVCTHTRECVAPDQVRSIRLSWTLYELPPDESLCEALGVTAMRVTFQDSAAWEAQSYEPVPCELGQVYFNRLPLRFTLVEIVALGGGLILESRLLDMQGPETIVTVDLSP